jgi:hypothetical protein
VAEAGFAAHDIMGMRERAESGDITERQSELYAAERSAGAMGSLVAAGTGAALGTAAMAWAGPFALIGTVVGAVGGAYLGEKGMTALVKKFQGEERITEVVKGLENPEEKADVINEAISGVSTDDELLAGVMSSIKSTEELGEVRRIYQEKYGESLKMALAGELSEVAANAGRGVGWGFTPARGTLMPASTWVPEELAPAQQRDSRLLASQRLDALQNRIDQGWGQRGGGGGGGGPVNIGGDTTNTRINNETLHSSPMIELGSSSDEYSVSTGAGGVGQVFNP